MNTDDKANHTDETETTDQPASRPKRRNTSKGSGRFIAWCKAHKRQLIITGAVVAAVLIVLAVVPVTRNKIAGVFVKKSVTVLVKDSQKSNPVSKATVAIGDKRAETDKDGKAVLEGIEPGLHEATISKELYKQTTAKVTVPIIGDTEQLTVAAEPTGRLVTVTVTDRIGGGTIANATIDAGNGNTATTDDKGQTSVVVPANAQQITASVSAAGYLTTKAATIKQAETSAIQLVPKGELYFLSKQSGKVDVVRTNLDGSNRKVVVAGTGNESDRETSLLASRDWNYLALLAKRDKNTALYLIDTTSGKLTTIDEGNDLRFDLVGWSGSRFIYSVTREKRQDWQAGRQALKSYNAPTQQLSVIDETQAGSEPESSAQSMSGFYILKGDQIVYIKDWYAEWDDGLGGRTDIIASIQADGSNKRALKSYKAIDLGYIEAKLYTPQEIHFRVWDNNYDRLENVMTVGGKLVLVPPAQQKFDQEYPTFLMSPDGTKSFWAEPRDGKNALFLGDDNATDSSKQQLTNLSAYSPYGWLTDKYLLLQKNSSELYITTADQIKKGASPLKVSDYHKPAITYSGYGYGYGGL